MDAPYFWCSYFWSLKTTKIIARNNRSKISILVGVNFHQCRPAHTIGLPTPGTTAQQSGGNVYLHRNWPSGDRPGRHTHASVYNYNIACAGWVVTKTTDRDSLRYTYKGTRRVRQLALGCESNWVKSTQDAYENTWKCGELKLYFSPSAGG